MASKPVLDWKFIQSFGDDNSSSDDLVTALEFEKSGRYLAVGDKAGRICIFQECKDVSGRCSEYRFYTEFQSHEAGFDYLKSLDLEEEISDVKFCQQRQPGMLHVLATNDHTIKLWKVHGKQHKRVQRPAGLAKGAKPAISRGGEIAALPHLVPVRNMIRSTCKAVYRDAHGFHINSIAINSDGETFISVDDLRINLWNLEISDTSFNIIDQRPANMEELTEVITCADLSPTNCSLLVHANSAGTIHVADMRENALCDHSVKVFEPSDNLSERSFYSEVISSVSDIKFTQDGRFLLSRDYMTMKVWDLAMERGPVSVIPVHDHLEPYMADLYKNDCIFDSFNCDVSPDGRNFVTGSYNNTFIHHEKEAGQNVHVEALKDRPRYRPDKPPPAIDVQAMDFGKKSLHVAWHPAQDLIAMAGLNKLYIYRV